jgi:hypothetical protein
MRFPHHIASFRSKALRTVYFVEGVGSGLIKIGITDRLVDRLVALRVNSPMPVVLLLSIRATRRQERALQHRFAADHSHGEWFRADGVGDLRSLVERFRSMSQSEISAVLRRLPTPPTAAQRKASAKAKEQRS